MTLLLIAYVATGYGYFWSVLGEDDGRSATPAELASCALLGLLLGPLLWGLALAVRALEAMRRRQGTGCGLPPPPGGTSTQELTSAQ